MKDMIKRIREEREGFTLAELLIVVAIIAVLVAIAIPVFNGQLEKSREAVDASNIRAAYAECMAEVLGNGSDQNGVCMKVEAKQTKTGWVSDPELIGGKIDLKGSAPGNAFADASGANKTLYVCVSKDGEPSLSTTAVGTELHASTTTGSN